MAKLPLMEPLQVSYAWWVVYFAVMFKIKLLNFVFQFLSIGRGKFVMEIADVQPSFKEFG